MRVEPYPTLTQLTYFIEWLRNDHRRHLRYDMTYIRIYVCYGMGHASHCKSSSIRRVKYAAHRMWAIRLPVARREGGRKELMTCLHAIVLLPCVNSLCKYIICASSGLILGWCFIYLPCMDGSDFTLALRPSLFILLLSLDVGDMFFFRRTLLPWTTVGRTLHQIDFTARASLRVIESSRKQSWWIADTSTQNETYVCIPCNQRHAIEEFQGSSRAICGP